MSENRLVSVFKTIENTSDNEHPTMEYRRQALSEVLGQLADDIREMAGKCCSLGAYFVVISERLRKGDEQEIVAIAIKYGVRDILESIGFRFEEFRGKVRNNVDNPPLDVRKKGLKEAIGRCLQWALENRRQMHKSVWTFLWMIGHLLDPTTSDTPNDQVEKACKDAGIDQILEELFNQ